MTLWPRVREERVRARVAARKSISMESVCEERS